MAFCRDLQLASDMSQGVNTHSGQREPVRRKCGSCSLAVRLLLLRVFVVNGVFSVVPLGPPGRGSPSATRDTRRSVFAFIQAHLLDCQRRQGRRLSPFLRPLQSAESGAQGGPKIDLTCKAAQNHCFAIAQQSQNAQEKFQEFSFAHKARLCVW